MFDLILENSDFLQDASTFFKQKFVFFIQTNFFVKGIPLEMQRDNVVLISKLNSIDCLQNIIKNRLNSKFLEPQDSILIEAQFFLNQLIEKKALMQESLIYKQNQELYTALANQLEYKITRLNYYNKLEGSIEIRNSFINKYTLEMQNYRELAIQSEDLYNLTQNNQSQLIKPITNLSSSSNVFPACGVSIHHSIPVNILINNNPSLAPVENSGSSISNAPNVSPSTTSSINTNYGAIAILVVWYGISFLIN